MEHVITPESKRAKFSHDDTIPLNELEALKNGCKSVMEHG